MKRSLLTALVVTAFAARLVVGATPAFADSLNINYYTVAENDKDANHLASGVYTNEVQSTLGANGLPVLNTTTYGCVTNCYAISGAPTDVLADGEITYWSPALNNGGAAGASDVTLTGTGTVTLPFSDDTFFTPNGTGSNDNSGFQAAELYGNILAPTDETIGFSIGSDDMAFLYLDGVLQCSDGGVHGSSSVPCTTSTISAGSHTLQLFFVDINNTQSALDFSVTTQGITTTPSVPEPSTLAMFGTGLIGFAGAVRRRLSR